MVAIASRLAFSRLDKASQGLHNAIVDAGNEPAQYPEPVPADHIGGLHHWFDLRTIGGNRPGFEKAATVAPALLGVEIAEGLLQAICLSKPSIASHDQFELLFLLLSKVLWVLQDQISTALDGLIRLPFLASDLIDSICEHASNMESVKGDRCLREVLGNAFDESRRHVTGYLFHLVDATLVALKKAGKSRNSRVILACGGEYQTSLIQIEKQAYVVVVLAGGGLINTNAGNGRAGGLRQRLLYVMLENTPNALVRDVQQTANRPHGHVPGQFQDHGLHEQREAAIGASPWNTDQFDATGRTFDSGNPGDDECLMLEEIEMSPSLFIGIIDRTTRFAARGAGEFGAVGIGNSQIKLSRIGHELGLNDMPWRDQAKSLGKERVGVHEAHLLESEFDSSTHSKRRRAEYNVR
jgi:hypothetical protein